MNCSAPIRCDGKSPLTHYIDFLSKTLDDLDARLRRDAQAIELVTQSVLRTTINRTEQLHWKEEHEKRTGAILCSPRIWTRRDKKRADFQNNLSSGPCPESRTERYLRRVSPKENQLFRAAINEAREDGNIGVLSVKLDKAHSLFQKMAEAARLISQDERQYADFEAITPGLSMALADLLSWTKPPQADQTVNISDARIQPLKNDREKGKTRQATVNEQMAGMIMKNPNAMGWSSPEWAKTLKCGKSTVVETPTWKNLETVRLDEKAKRAKDRRRKPKASDRRRD